MVDKRVLNHSLLINTASFDDFGGWTLDTEFILTMGGTYLLAHGLGKKVGNAKTAIHVEKSGRYHVYAYTYNWVSPWHKDMAPGIFRIRLEDGVSSILGAKNDHWAWEYAGAFFLTKGDVALELEDMTGFEGRCAYIFLTEDENAILPEGPSEVFGFYKKSISGACEIEEKTFDFTVFGGGFAGMCAAVAASRSGLNTCLVQDRSVVGGNNSSEIRVWLGGGTNYEPFGGIGNIVGEFEQKKIGHYGSVNKAELYEDEKKMAVLSSEKNLTLFMNCSLVDSEVKDGIITSALCWDFLNDRFFSISSPLFADCTGDGNLGAMSGADYEVTTNGHMGMSNLWHIEKVDDPSPFPSCPWAVDLKNCNFPGRGETKDIYGNSREFSLGCWFWESGMTEDPINYAERSRDMNFRAMYGAWDTLRNHDGDYKDYDLTFCSPLGGKRESRRLLGDLVLTKADFKYSFPDACCATTWNFDVHYPDKAFYSCFHEGDAFLTMDCREEVPGDCYFLPYRIMYSRNVKNMFMAGRCASLSHDASGTARVMRTCGMMGEVVGYASSICKKYGCLPRDVYQKHLDEFIALLKSFENKEVFKAGNTIV